MDRWMKETTRRAGLFLAGAMLACASSWATAAGPVADVTPKAPPSLPIIAPPVPADMPRAAETTLDRTTAVEGKTSPAKLVNTRLLPRPPRPYPGPKIAVEHIIEGEDAKMEKLEMHEQHALPKPSTRHRPLGPRGGPDAMFPGSDTQSSPFIPPDPTVACGTQNIIMTANSLCSVWTRQGELVQEFSLMGPDGLFGSQGAGFFVFDPKCLYDALEDRFVIVALEYYESTEFSSILIALSAPGDAQTWTTFRSDAKTAISGVGNAWFDYPGFGYDQNAYYVTGNLFTFGDFASFRGVKFRIFNKQKLIAGLPDNFADLNDFSRSFSSVQSSQHFGSTPTPYFVSVGGTSSQTFLQIHSILSPVANPSRAMKVVVLSQSYNQPDFISACCEDTDDPGCGAGFINTVDDRVFNATWRNGQLYTGHHFTTEAGVVTARWYEVATNGWPTDSSKSPSFVQGGDISGGTTGDGRSIHTFFPAIHVNSLGQVGAVIGMAVEGECAQVGFCGRLPSDPTGAMSDPVSVKTSDGTDQDDFRWGDYYGIALDPIDGKTFWAIGQYNKKFADGAGQNDGWATWIFSFDIANPPSLFAVDDGFDQQIVANAGDPLRIDVQANDYDTQNLTFDIDAFDSTTPAGGTVTLSIGTGPGGRDELEYTPPLSFEGEDTFDYTIRNSQNVTDSAIVKVNVLPAQFLDAEDPGLTEGGIDVLYYVGQTNATDFPDNLPPPYTKTWVPNLNFPQAEGVPFANSGRTTDTVAVFSGYIVVPQQDMYEFCLLRGSGASLFIQDNTIIDDHGVHTPAEGPICGQVGLKAGAHRFRVEFFHATGPHGLMLLATGGGLHNQLLPNGWYLRAADCTADFDQTGFVDIDDYVAFVNAFELGDPACDVDGTGFVDTDDFDYFVCAFVAGCDCG